MHGTGAGRRTSPARHPRCLADRDVPLAAGSATVSLRRLGSCAVRVDRLDVAWNPAPTATWQWQLSGTLDSSVAAEMYDVDLFDTPRERRRAAPRAGRPRRLLLQRRHVRAGPSGRGPFPATVARQAAGGLARTSAGSTSAARRARRRSWSAGWTCARARASTASRPTTSTATPTRRGFPLTAADQLRFNRFLAAAAHARGLSIGLKNDLDQVAAARARLRLGAERAVLPVRRVRAAARRSPRPGKAVFDGRVRARRPTRSAPRARADGFMAMRKRLELDAVAAAVLVSVTGASAGCAGARSRGGATRAVGSPSRVARWTVAMWRRPQRRERLRR